MTLQPPHPGRIDRVLRRIALTITNAIKVAGVYLVVRAAAHPPIDPLVLATTAFMMSGAQVSEAAVLRMIARFFDWEGDSEKPKSKEPEK